jgi:hypothetical protein
VTDSVGRRRGRQSRDADGNETCDGSRTCEWDGEDRHLKCEKYDHKLEFAYDYQGQRVGEQVFAGSSGNWTQTSDLGFIYAGWNLMLLVVVRQA